MSGSGHPPEKLSGKLMNEIRSILAMLRKEVRHHGVDFEIQGHLTVFSAGFHCDSVSVALEELTAPVYHCQTLVNFGSSRPINLFSTKTPKVSGNMGSLANLETTVHQAPVFEGIGLPVYGVGFGNLAVQPPMQVSIPEAPAVSVHEVSTTGPAKPRKVFLIPRVRFKATQKPRKLGHIRAKSHSASQELLTLPILKYPIPPHRFNSQTRSRFRQALAEKAGCPPAKIQINRVYDRITMSAFQSLAQDERGILVCYLKPEAVGTHRKQPPVSTSSYLVAGQVLNTRQQISVLVPMYTEETP